MGPGGVPLVQAPYGEEAEGLFPVRATAVERTVAGTEYAPYLKAKGTTAHEPLSRSVSRSLLIAYLDLIPQKATR